MKVKELIEELRSLPQDADVYLKFLDKEWCNYQHNPVNVTYVDSDGTVIISETKENN